jgi:hypothetical protein
VNTAHGCRIGTIDHAEDLVIDKQSLHLDGPGLIVVRGGERHDGRMRVGLGRRRGGGDHEDSAMEEGRVHEDGVEGEQSRYGANGTGTARRRRAMGLTVAIRREWALTGVMQYADDWTVARRREGTTRSRNGANGTDGREDGAESWQSREQRE